MNQHLTPLNRALGDLAKLVAGELQGDPDFVIRLPATLPEARAQDIAFFGNPKYADVACASLAGCLLITESHRALNCRAPNKLIVEDPQWAFAQILSLLEGAAPPLPSVVDARASIDPQARLAGAVGIGAYTVVAAHASIGEGTKIAAQCFIGEGAQIGRDCVLHPQVVVREHCVIGDRVVIQPGAKIGGDGFGFSPDRRTGALRKIPQVGIVYVGDDVEIGANVTIDRAMIGATVIGEGTKIDNLVMVAHGVKVGRSCILVSQVGIAGSSELGDRVVLGGQVGLVGHIKLGDGVQVGAQSGIMADVPKATVMFGYPARPHRESFKLQALYGRLPEMYESLKAIQKKLGLETRRAVKTESPQ